MYVTKALKPKIAFSYCRISHVLCIIRNFIFSCFYFILTIGHIGPAHHALSRYILYLTDKGVATLILVLYIICTGHSFCLVYFYFCSPHLANPLYLICKVDTPIQCLLIYFILLCFPLPKLYFALYHHMLCNFQFCLFSFYAILFAFCLLYKLYLRREM